LHYKSAHPLHSHIQLENEEDWRTRGLNNAKAIIIVMKKKKNEKTQVGQSRSEGIKKDVQKVTIEVLNLMEDGHRKAG
jgi:hypothetical protein